MLMIVNLQFLKSSFNRMRNLISPTPTLDQLRPVFIGHLGLKKFYHRHQTKTGHNVITPYGIGEIMTIIRLKNKILFSKYAYRIKLIDNVVVYFKEKELKYLVVYPVDFLDNKIPLLLSFADYMYGNPSGITEGEYVFRITTHGYAMMTNETRKKLEINKILSKLKGGKRFIKIMKAHNFHIVKKEKSNE